MCIVIDINTLTPVFSNACAKHREFAPVKKWVEARQGVIVVGGTKYKAELAKAAKYLRLIRLMREAGQAIFIQDHAVDRLEYEVKQKTQRTMCDDQHVIALLGASHCPLLCSADQRSFDFVKDRALYPKGMARVKIYSSLRNKKLLIPMDRAALTNVDG